MNRNKLSLLIAALAAVVVVAGGWFLGVQPQLSSASAANAQRATIEQTNASNRTELARLQQQFATLDTMKSNLATLSESVPSQADTETFIRSLNDTASANGVAISSISISDPQAYAPPAGSAAAATTDTATGTSTASPSASATPTPTAAPTPTGPTSTTNPAITAANFTDIPVTVLVKGSYSQALAFTKGMQDGQRLFLIDTIASSADSTAQSTDAVSATGSSGGDTSWTLSGYIYVLNATATTPTDTTGTTATNG